MFGKKTFPAEGVAAEAREAAVLHDAGLTAESFARLRQAVDGAPAGTTWFTSMI